MNINCIEKCEYQKSGKCTMYEIPNFKEGNMDIKSITNISNCINLL